MHFASFYAQVLLFSLKHIEKHAFSIKIMARYLVTIVNYAFRKEQCESYVLV